MWAVCTLLRPKWLLYDGGKDETDGHIFKAVKEIPPLSINRAGKLSKGIHVLLYFDKNGF
jgi:hypothetical protein